MLCVTSRSRGVQLRNKITSRVMKSHVMNMCTDVVQNEPPSTRQHKKPKNLINLRVGFTIRELYTTTYLCMYM